MSILSWDDFEDDEPKQAAQKQQPAPVEPQKAIDTPMVSDARNEPSRVAAAQPARTNQSTTKHSTDSLARASAALDRKSVV